jgi:hypothetical protein
MNWCAGSAEFTFGFFDDLRAFRQFNDAILEGSARIAGKPQRRDASRDSSAQPRR